MDESKNNDHHYLDDDDDDDSDYGDINNSIQTNNNINKAPSAFAPSDLSIGGIAIDTSLSSHCNSVILREKVVIVGDESVGKTSLVRSFLSLSHSHSHHQGMEGKFKSRTSSTGRYIRDEDYQMTVGIDWNVKQVPIPTSIMNNNNNNNNNTNNREDVNIKTNRNINKNITVDLFLFDVGGQSIFNQRGLSSRFYKNCSYIICVFDVSSRKSLKSCDTWIQAVKSSLQRQGQEQQQQQEEVARTILVANKVDLRDDNDYTVEVDDEEGMQFAKERNLPYFECCTDRPSTVDAPFMYIATQAASRYQEEEEEEENEGMNMEDIETY